jgi:hypothetical protein
MPRANFRLTEAEQVELRSMIRTDGGPDAVARRAGVSPDVVTRLAAGLDGIHGSVVLVRTALHEPEARVG